MSESPDNLKTLPADSPAPGPPAKTVPVEASPVPPPSNNDPATLPHVPVNPSGIAFTPGRTFGEYELLAEVGRGGMGVVYKAVQKNLSRLVALKMVLSGTLSNAQEIQRFRTEAEAAARLQHPNIVQVYEVGVADGVHFFSMEFVEGQSLAERVSEGPLPNATAARYVMLIARAVHHAHRHDILHRDLKPSNILLDIDDQPKVADFGLAKKLDDSSQTRTGAVMGTPSYMPPEQAAGRTRDMGPASDVYSIGAILYEMLTGRPPFQSETALDTLRHVMERDPAPPRLLNPKVARDLETICLKCLEKDPRERYASAEALADDLQRFLNGDSISARSLNVFDRLAHTLERNQYIAEFSSWGNMVLVFAVVVLVEHLFVFVIAHEGLAHPRLWIMGARTAQFTVMALVFWQKRRHMLLPTSAAERQFWSIWIGYFIACTLAPLVNVELNHVMNQHRDTLSVYPIWAVLSGLAFFVMGSNYWGWCYAVGVGFFGLSLVMPLELSWASLEFGVAWTATLTTIGLHMRRLGKQSAAEKGPPNITSARTPGRSTQSRNGQSV